MEKKNIIITSVLVVIAFIVGYFVGDASAINRVNSAISTKVSNSTNTTAQSNQTKKEDKKIYKLGEEGQSGAWSIKVLDTQETNTIASGDGSDNKTTQQKFIVIKLQMTNISQAPTQYSDNEFILGNTKDKKQYQINGDASLTANQVETTYKKNSDFFLSIDSLNPSMPKQTYMVFEVPTNFNVADGVLIHGTSSSDAVGYYIK